jgi:hypothetical protein
MFAQSEEEREEPKQTKNVKKDKVPFLNKMEPSQTTTISINKLDSLLEKEKQNQKCEQWNKIDKTVKTQILHSYAEKYGQTNKLPTKEIKKLKLFFSESLNKGKLQKNKDLVYNRETQQIQSIPALFFNTEKNNFTLRITDSKRISTLKSLTPKKK